jgi:hypothetical protein
MDGHFLKLRVGTPGLHLANLFSICRLVMFMVFFFLHGVV